MNDEQPEFRVRGQVRDLSGEMVDVELTVRAGDPGYAELVRTAKPNPLIRPSGVPSYGELE